MFDALGKRMKENYESIPKTRLLRRTPVIIRIDGKAFHTFTRGLDIPFDQVLMETMRNTMFKLCSSIQGCVFGYTQSDEISLLLIDYKRFNSCAWFDNEVQKICSISASMATLYFNQVFEKELKNVLLEKDMDHYERLRKAQSKGALFDARCFNVPREEVTNYFYWRQQDAIRNSIQMVGQANFSQAELQNKSCEQIIEMLKNLDSSIDFYADYKTVEQRGACCMRVIDYFNYKSDSNVKLEKDAWFIDFTIPVFKGESRSYIEKLLLPEEE